MQKREPAKIVLLDSEVTELQAQLEAAIEAKEKAKTSIQLLGKLLEVANFDLMRALDHINANASKVSGLDSAKSRLQAEYDKLKTKETAWL